MSCVWPVSVSAVNTRMLVALAGTPEIFSQDKERQMGAKKRYYQGGVSLFKESALLR